MREPPAIRPEALTKEILAPLTKADLPELESLGKTTPAIAQAMDALERRLGVGAAREVYLYALSRAPGRVAEGYVRGLVSMLAEAKIGVQQSALVRDVVDSLARCSTVEESKRVVDEKLELYGCLADFVSPLTALTAPLGIDIVHPGEKLVPRAATTATGGRILFIDELEEISITPYERTIIAGPTMQAKRGGGFEVRFLPTEKGGDCAVRTDILWEEHGCFFYRYWVPVGYGAQSIVPPEEAVFRFRFEPDWARVVGIRITPYAVESSGCAVRRISTLPPAP